MTVESCDECRFDGRHYNRTDTRRTLVSMAVRWRWAADGIDESVLASRPGLGRLSPVEHAAAAAGTATTTYADGVDEIDRRAVDVERRFATGEITLDDAHDYAHRAGHALTAACRAIHALGAGAPRREGVVAGLFASRGGVPKQAIDRATIGYRGVDGDRQAAREHHGRVWQALCLWSVDVIARLQEEGHPIGLGRAGENISIAGVDWASLRPGTRIAMGDVLAEVSSYATPCKKNAAWFLDGDFNRMNHDREPGVSRLYAGVLRDGVVSPGDPVTVEPD